MTKAGDSFHSELGAASVAGIDDHRWGKDMADTEGRVQRSGKTHRLDERGMVQRDHGLGGTAGGFKPDAATNDNLVILLEKSKGAAFVLTLDAGPILSQRVDFALDGGDDGDFRHSR